MTSIYSLGTRLNRGETSMVRKLLVLTIFGFFGLFLLAPTEASAHGFGHGYGKEDCLNGDLKIAVVDEGVEFPEDAEADECDDDGDGVPSTVENSSPAHESTPPADETPGTPGAAGGDHNADGKQDYKQSQVATLPNPNDQENSGSYITLEVLTPGWNIKQFETTTPEEVDPDNLPEDSNFPVGLFDIRLENQTLQTLIGIKSQLNCDQIRSRILKAACVKLDGELAEEIEERREVTVRLLFDRVIDHSDWDVQQYVEGQYVGYTAEVKDEVVGFLRTTITWTLVDGGEGDLDGITGANGVIVDPIGPSVAVATVTPTPTTTTGAVLAAAAQSSKLAVTGGSSAIAIVAGILLAATMIVVGAAFRSEQNA